MTNGNRRRTILWIVGVVVLVLAGVGGLAAYRLLRVDHDLSRARDLLTQASSELDAGRVGPAESHLTEAETLLIAANNRLYGSPELDIVGALPIAGDNLDALRDTVSTGLQLVTGGRRILAVTEPLQNADGRIQVPLTEGTIPLQVVADAQREVEALARVLPGPGEKPGGLLVGPVSSATDRVYAEAFARKRQLDGVSHGLALLSELAGLNGPRRYLISVANTAEMRGAGGMMLSYGILTSSKGTFELGDFGNIEELLLPGPVDASALGLPADYLARWQGQSPTELWRNTNLNPDLAFDAPVMEAMYRAKTKQKVDGVIQIDPSGLAAILKGIGPVDVAGVGQVSADNVVDLTLNKAYIDFPNRDQRQEVLGDVAKQVFKHLVSGKFGSLRALGDALYQAGVERHIIFAPDSVPARTDAGWFSATGEIPPADAVDYTLMTVQNFGKNKLDYYLDTSLDITGDRPAGQAGHLTATITVHNDAPAATAASAYIFGPNAPDQEAGLYNGLVSLYLPVGSSVSSSQASNGLADAAGTQAEAGRSVATFGVHLRPGESTTVTLQLDLAPRRSGEPYQFQLVPVPRVRPTTVSLRIDPGGGEVVARPAGPLTVLEVVHPKAPT